MRKAISVIGLLFAVFTFAQEPPRRTECLQWDQAYAQAVIVGIIGAILFAAVLGLTIGFLFGRRWWWAASARLRIWIAGTFAAVAAELVVVVWPRVFPLGKSLYASIDPRYADCQTLAFGAPGLLHGAIGEGVAAFAQWQAVTALLFGASALGALCAWLLSEALVRSGGLETAARGGEA